MMTNKLVAVAGAALGLVMAGPAVACPGKIGATLSLTGSYSTFGPPISNAAQLAVEQIAEAGWKVGNCTKLEYLVRDDQTQPSVGVDAARRLIDLDGVGAMVGPISSGVTGPILSSVTVERGVLVIPAASSSPTFTELAKQGKTQGLLFRTQPSDALQAVAAAKLAIDAGYKKMAIVNLNNDWGNNLSKQFVATYKALGGTVTGHVTYNAEQASYRAEVNKALQGDPESLYLAATPIDGSKIMRDWLAVGGPQKYVFPLGLNDRKFVDQIGEQYLKNAWFLTPGSPEPNSAKLYRDAYEKRWNASGVGPGRDSGYDAAAIIALAMVAAQDYKDGKKIAAAIPKLTDPNGETIYASVADFSKAIKLLSEGKTIRYVGATGAMTFDQYGDVSTPFVGWVIEKNDFVAKKNITAQEVADTKSKTGT